MKKWGFVASAALVFGLTACGDSSSASDATTMSVVNDVTGL